ncbi:MAG: transcriptional regulator [Candidatus Aminicenantes bacterium]|nr:transcriptional regulator [Candidatus Aminicenantes bacterium]
MKNRNSNPNLQSLANINKVIHEPARLAVLAQLYVLESADFLFLMNRIGLTQGNLSSHITRLETEGLITVKKGFVGKRPHTLVGLTDRGRKAFADYILDMKALFVGLSAL